MTIVARGPTIADRESKPLPRLVDSPQGSSLALIPPAGEANWDGGAGEDGDEEESTPTPTLQSLSSSAVSFSSSLSSSPSISPSSSITTNTSVTSDTHQAGLSSDKVDHEENKATKQEKKGLNNDTIVPTLVSDTNADPKRADASTLITSSMSVSVSSTPSSSSSSSLPVPSPTPSSSASTSTSPSTTTVNDLGIDSNGLLSLLRPHPQINQNMNVKFAPLPDLKPRKRKSSTPLGMAARSQLARKRRVMYQDSYDDDRYEESYRPRRFPPPPGMSEGGEVEGGVRQGKKVKKKTVEEKEKRTKKEGDQFEAEPEILSALAKKMGRAGKQFWKKMASGGNVKGEKDDVGEDEKKLDAEVVVGVVGTTTGDPEKEPKVDDGQEGPVEDVGEAHKKSQGPKAEDSGKVEPGPHLEALPPPLPSKPQSVTNDLTEGSLPPGDEGDQCAATSHESFSDPDNQQHPLPSTPSILVSAS